MIDTMPHLEKDISNFIDALDKLTDPRDNRGKRHSLAFIIASSILAILTGRSTVSSIFRYIFNRIEWLRNATGIHDAKPISRAHLPRLLAQLDWEELNSLIEKYFGVRMERTDNQEWVAVDGKVLRGTVKSGEKQAIVLAVSHESRVLLAQARQTGPKSSEIPVVRQLLKDSGLENEKVTLDAHHCNPTTTAQIHQADGYYLIQVKENQPILLEQCKELAKKGELVGSDTNIEKAHGRITTRWAKSFSMETLTPDKRWKNSGLQTLLVIKRETFEKSTKKTSDETSYYITNKAIEKCLKEKTKKLAQAIRKHWSVESENWIRDVTFKEDKIKTKSGNQAQIMGGLRSLAARLLRKAKVKNFQAAIETFADCTDKFEAMLRRLKFL